MAHLQIRTARRRPKGMSNPQAVCMPHHLLQVYQVYRQHRLASSACLACAVFSSSIKLGMCLCSCTTKIIGASVHKQIRFGTTKLTAIIHKCHLASTAAVFTTCIDFIGIGVPAEKLFLLLKAGLHQLLRQLCWMCFTVTIFTRHGVAMK